MSSHHQFRNYLTAPRVSNQGAEEEQNTFVGGMTPYKQVLRGNGT
jgi:hypothetical protein